MTLPKLAIALGACALFVAAGARAADDYEDVLIKTPDGAQISAFVVRPRDASRKLPAALQFTIYADQSALAKAQQAASRGYCTGKDVSDESIADAKEPLRVEWFNDSHVDIPVSQ